MKKNETIIGLKDVWKSPFSFEKEKALGEHKGWNNLGAPSVKDRLAKENKMETIGKKNEKK